MEQRFDNNRQHPRPLATITGRHPGKRDDEGGKTGAAAYNKADWRGCPTETSRHRRTAAASCACRHPRVQLTFPAAEPSRATMLIPARYREWRAWSWSEHGNFPV